MKKNNKKGFTLAELLIVVAIIGVLVAISIPVFTAQLDKAKLATDTANARSAVAEVVAESLTADPPVEITDDMISAAVTGAMTQGCTAEAGSGTVTVTSPGGLANSFTYDLD